MLVDELPDQSADVGAGNAVDVFDDVFGKPVGLIVSADAFNAVIVSGSQILFENIRYGHFAFVVDKEIEELYRLAKQNGYNSSEIARRAITEAFQSIAEQVKCPAV